jgi:alpha-L-rhamnosidase
MGQNMVGYARLKVNGKAGDKVRMRFVEILEDDGTVYRDNLRRAEATDTYILKGDGEEIFEPHFTYHGFRYIEVTGYPGGAPSKDAITGLVFHTDAPIIGDFDSSNEMVNKVVKNTMWGIRGNMMSVPTDCPQRDERLGWTGDAQAIWKTACYNMDLIAFTEKFMRDMVDAQSEAGGFSNVVPRVVVLEEGAPAWGDAGIILPYQTWRMYGDVHLLDKVWSDMEEWLAYIKEENPNYLWLKRRSHDFGDWVPAESETNKDLIATAYWAGDARMMSEMAAALGKQDKVREYDELYNNIRKAFQEKFITPDGKIANGSQTSYILALHNKLVQDELVDKAVGLLVADIKKRNNHLSTGFLGTTYLMPVLTEHGQHDVAMTLLLNKTYPSWGYMVEKGATTIWERWNSDTGDPGMNSFNHYTYGALTDWLYGYLVGIRPVAPGYQKMLIEPHPEARLQYARAKYNSVYGPITSNWKYEGDKLTLNVVIPANTTAKVSLPVGDAAKVTVGGKSMAEAGFKPVVENGRAIIDAGSGKYDFVITK